MSIRRLLTLASFIGGVLCSIILIATPAGAQKSAVCGGHDAVFIGTLDGTPYCSSWNTADSRSPIPPRSHFFAIGKHGKKIQLLNAPQRNLVDTLFHRHAAPPDAIPAPHRAQWSARSLSFIDDDTGKKWVFHISEDGRSLHAESVEVITPPQTETANGRLLRADLTRTRKPAQP